MSQDTLGIGDLVIGAGNTSFATQVSSCEIAYNHDYQDGIPVLANPSPGQTFSTRAELNGEAVQDFQTSEALGGMQAFCEAHNGELMPFTFTPKTPGEGGLLTATGTIRISAINIGGEVGTTPTKQPFTFPCEELPTLTWTVIKTATAKD